MVPAYHTLVETYVHTCCSTLSTADFYDSVSKDVQLFHQTNEESPIKAEGRAAVQELFEKYIFNNTSQIHILNYSIIPIESASMMLQLSVEENKQNEGVTHRYHFDETTLFHFKKDNGAYKICSIEMKVKRSLIN